jgi:hypothetical protein
MGPSIFTDPPPPLSLRGPTPQISPGVLGPPDFNALPPDGQSKEATEHSRRPRCLALSMAGITMATAGSHASGTAGYVGVMAKPHPPNDCSGIY